MLRTLIVAVGHDAPALPPEIDITEEVVAFAGHMEDDEGERCSREGIGSPKEVE
jgi:hypothetical protein